MLKALILIHLIVISYQDIKAREVYWFLFPALAALLGWSHYQHSLFIHFINAVGINIAMVSVILGILYLYNVLIIKKKFLEEVFGLGDVLFLYAVAIGFPTISFLVILVFSIFFSLILWIAVKRFSSENTAPLAGFASLFLLILLSVNWVGGLINLYLI
ncbi:prepilin peptidase [Aquimarina hainanensis]|uniref:Prepilin peptidase n=1 Tax=Aquimarina hainanensis TaxID=1578017 RepID=A0ABW5N912_9FLAO|nr:prepilin peptidase [Aquimarina sp. TRL1]QKX03548.1 hypothetical protein HN014_01000 [Aquimarina sp. TRL1]